jgi:tetraacyldisaccharide 4'-kinase
MSLLVGKAGIRLARAWKGAEPSRSATLLAGGYRGLLEARDWLYRRRILLGRPLPCGVVSIGNLTLGGTGKTPAVVCAVETLRALGARPAVVSRGYGRRSRGLRVVADGDAIRCRAEESGDEPMLLARRLPRTPVLVSRDRYEAARHAMREFGATTIVLDDGFQHRSLVKHAEIVLAGAQRPWGNGRLFPAGPLREPLAGLRRASLIVATGAADGASIAEIEAARDRWAPGIPIARAVHVPERSVDVQRGQSAPACTLAGKRLLAFAGIAAPDAFRRTLGELGVEILAFQEFPDHHWYRPGDIEELASRRARAGAEALVTTEKDWVRLDAHLGRLGPLYVVTIRTVLVAGEALWRSLLRTVVR